MAPRGIRNFPDYKNTTSSAAVLILIYPENNEPFTVLMKRTVYPGAHSGQISFPGGKIEPTDTDLEQTALRETSEELGIKADKIKIIGRLSTLYIPVSGFDVHPFIGIVFEKPEWEPDLNEVAYLIEISIKELSSPDIIKSEKWLLRGNEADVPFYFLQNEKIWGATAMIISEFLEITKSIKQY